MKTIARLLIYTACMLAGAVLLVIPFKGFMDTGELDTTQTLIHIAVGFGLIFLGCEASDRLKERWK